MDAPPPASTPFSRAITWMMRVAVLIVVAMAVGFFAADARFAAPATIVAWYGALLVATATLILTPIVALVTIGFQRPPRASTSLRWLGRSLGYVTLLVALGIAIGAEGMLERLTGGAFVILAAWAIVRGYTLPKHPDRRGENLETTGIAMVAGAATFVLLFLNPGEKLQNPRIAVRAIQGDLLKLAAAQAGFRDSAGRFASAEELEGKWRSTTGAALSLSLDSLAWSAIGTEQNFSVECSIWAGRRPADPRFDGEESQPRCMPLGASRARVAGDTAGGATRPSAPR